jgi:uncharacterized protein (TIGR03067 family)
MRWSSFLLVFGLLGVSDGQPSADIVKKDLQQFQGSWRAVSIQHVDGRQATQDELQNTTLVIDGNKFTLTLKDLAVSGTFTIDPAKSPKTIDVVLATAKKPDEKLLGIYQLQGDTRQSCFAVLGKERPKDFTKSVMGHLRLEWKRQSPDSPPQ